MTGRRAVIAVGAVIVALLAGGFGGWGLHQVRASTTAAPGASPSASPTPAATATPTPTSSPSGAAQQPRKRVALIGDSLTYGSGLTPTPATHYVDDVTVSLGRIP